MSTTDREAASTRIAEHLVACSAYSNAELIAAYLSLADEVDLSLFVEHAHQDRKKVYVPRIADAGPRMQFARLKRGASLTRNRFGINEPSAQEAEYAEPAALQLVVMPLVGFDGRGNRLGMGAGYYDRAFAFCRNAGSSRTPILFGAAFSCQRFESVEQQEWDVPLDYIVTEDGVERASRIDRNT